METINVPGRCRCGQVRFILREEPISFYLCHCTDCQVDSGSAFGQSMHVRAEAIDAVEGPVADYKVEGPDGPSGVVAECTACRTSLWFGRNDIPQVRGLNAGSLEDVAGLTPYGNMWTRSARPWVAFAPGPQFEKQPDDPLAMIHAWQGRPRP